jgi:UDP-glucose 4-epimerase
MYKLVTGGAGFIGSHLVDEIMRSGYPVKVYDNLSSGNLKNIREWMDKDDFEFIEGDLLDLEKLKEAVDNCDVIYHLAANPEVDAKKSSPEIHFNQNIKATYNLLEAIKNAGHVKRLIFTSSSTIYGDVDVFPTPENYGPLKPISLYGASKLACEVLISAYTSMYGFKSEIFRLANVVGPRSDHGVIFDFLNKLKKNPKRLEILGDGSQSKSYLYVSDCVNGLLLAKKAEEAVSIFNIGSADQINVLEIAQIIKEVTGNTEAELRLTGGVNGGRGWKGDVKFMHLDMNQLKRLGWEPRYNSAEAVQLTARALYDSSFE